MRTTLLTAGVLLALAACASTPKLSYHTIDMAPSGAVDARLNLNVDAFLTSEKLDRHQIVIQETATRVEYYSKARWAASVGEMVEQKLAAEFGPTVEGRRTLIVGGTVIAFEQVDTASGPIAEVTLDIVIRDGSAKRYEDPLLVKRYGAVRPADADNVDALIRAMSRALEAIAAEIAEDAAGL